MPVNFSPGYNYQISKTNNINQTSNAGVKQQNQASSGQQEQVTPLESFSQLFQTADSLQLSQQDTANNQQEQNPLQMIMDKMKEMLGMDNQQSNETEGGDDNKKARGTKDTKGGKQQGGLPAGGAELISFLNTLGLSPSGSKESDYTQVMNYLDNMEQNTGQDKFTKAVCTIYETKVFSPLCHFIVEIIT